MVGVVVRLVVVTRAASAAEDGTEIVGDGAPSVSGPQPETTTETTEARPTIAIRAAGVSYGHAAAERSRRRAGVGLQYAGP